MRTDPSLLISIVTYNNSDDISDCVNSVLDQTYGDFRLVIYDNHSQDGTVDVISNFCDKRITIIANQQNIGFGAAHNYNIRHFPADFVLLVNPDAKLTSNFLANGIDAFRRHPDIGSIASLLLNDSSATAVIDCAGIEFTRERRFMLRMNGRLFRDVTLKETYVDGVDGAVAFYRSSAVEDIMFNGQFFDESYFLYGEDWDVAWRFQLAGWKCLFSPSCIAYHSRAFKQRQLSNRRRLSKVVKFHSLKNSIISIIKNDDLHNFLLDIPFILRRFIFVFGYSLLFEIYSLKAVAYIFQHIPKILDARRKVQSHRKVTAIKLRSEFIK